MNYVFTFVVAFLFLETSIAEEPTLQIVIGDRKIAEAQWTQWTVWSSCSKTCGGGAQTRTRTCSNAAGQTCPGSAKEEKPCNTQLCPGQWTQWSGWSTCASREQHRTRTCTGGGPCPGLPRETRPCSEWGEWRPWSQCSVTCGKSGQQTRTRICLGGTDCPNPTTNTEKRPCEPQPPPCVKWTTWSAWSTCSRTCGGGDQQRNRTCLTEESNNTHVITSTLCKGPNRETQKCNLAACPIVKWSEWSAWSICASGRQTRQRTCQGGSGCPGVASESRPCSEPGRWSDYGPWSTCTKTCGGGEQTRQRTCIGGTIGSPNCIGQATEKRPCNTQICPTWSEWNWIGSCSVTCGNGARRRTRNCIGQGCIGVADETVVCNNGICKT